MHIDEVFTRREVAAKLRISLKTLSRMEKRGDLTGRVRISDRATGYRASTIVRFLDERTGPHAV